MYSEERQLISYKAQELGEEALTYVWQAERLQVEAERLQVEADIMRTLISLEMKSSF